MEGRVVLIWILIVGFVTGAEENLEFSSLEVAKLATHAYGTEFLLLENGRYTEQTSSYKFEDFFWTGSGDGPTTDDENAWISSAGPAVVYKTSTVTSTVFVEAPSTSTQSNESSTLPATNCSVDCRPPLTDAITPTPTLPTNTANQQFWLLTVLRSDGKDPVLTEIRNSLAKLYKMAFERQQARHLKLRQKRAAAAQNVDVFIHEINRQKENIELLYHVEVLGKAVDASTAADDMRLVDDDEVRRELGFLFDVKAEPYVKPAEPQSLLNKSKNTWFVIGGSIIGVLLVLLVLAFILGAAKGNKRPQSEQSLGTDNRRHVFERGAKGQENKGLVEEPSPTYVHFGGRHQVVLRPRSSPSSSSSGSSSLASLSRKLRRPKAAQNKTVPLNVTRRLPVEVLDSDSGASSSCRKDDFLEDFDAAFVSPKSYLSMPSVKSFPRSAMPEPLTRVLEPVSLTHLDEPHEDEEIYNGKRLVRHGSVGTVEDPGVIGPIVWSLHRERLRHGVSADQLKSTHNVSKMRKRFHDLLDDTFSLFGNSRRASPDVDEAGTRPMAIEVKSRSANDNRFLEGSIRPRPKTTGAKRPEAAPSCAWGSAAPSPLTRPLSAAPRTTTRVEGILKGPRVNVEHVLAEGRFGPSDPAIGVIEAIKGELEKVASLPGSSSILNE